MKTEIECRKNLSSIEFAEKYLYPHRPVVITDALRGWRAVSRWTPEFFKEEFGEMRFTIDDDKKGTVEFTMSAFIDRVLSSSESHPAEWCARWLPR